MNGDTDTVINSTTNSQQQQQQQKSLSLLIVISQTFSKEHKQLILNKINSSLLQIDYADLKEELTYVIEASQSDTHSYDQEYHVTTKNDTFEFELLINSTVNSFKNAFKSLLQSKCTKKEFLCAGIDQYSNSNLVFQDSMLSVDDLQALIKENSDSKSNTYTLNLNFNNSKLSNFQLSPNKNSSKQSTASVTNGHIDTQQQLVDLGSSPYNHFISFLGSLLNDKPIGDLMEETKLTGSLNVEKPCLYVFPAKEGDCSFFTFNGYSMIINGGFDRIKPCFFKFANVLKEVDSMLVTHTDADALGGITSFLSKKLAQPETKPNIRTLFGNFNNKNDDVELVLESAEKLRIKTLNLVKHEINTKPNQAPEHVNLFFKLGYGSLDLYVLSPFNSSSEYKEFIHQTHAKVSSQAHKSHLSVNGVFKNIPINHLCSAIVLLAWTPATPGEHATRMLFTGNAPQHVIFNALDRIKDFDLVQTAVYKIKEEVPKVKKVSHPHNATKSIKEEKSSELTLNSGSSSSTVSKPQVKSTNGTSSKPPAQNGSSAKSQTNGHSKSIITNLSQQSQSAKPPKAQNGVLSNETVKKQDEKKAPATTTKSSHIAKKDETKSKLTNESQSSNRISLSASSTRANKPLSSATSSTIEHQSSKPTSAPPSKRTSAVSRASTSNNIAQKEAPKVEAKPKSAPAPKLPKAPTAAKKETAKKTEEKQQASASTLTASSPIIKIENAQVQVEEKLEDLVPVQQEQENQQEVVNLDSEKTSSLESAVNESINDAPSSSQSPSQVEPEIVEKQELNHVKNEVQENNDESVEEEEVEEEEVVVNQEVEDEVLAEPVQLETNGHHDSENEQEVEIEDNRKEEEVNELKCEVSEEKVEPKVSMEHQLIIDESLEEEDVGQVVNDKKEPEIELEEPEAIEKSTNFHLKMDDDDDDDESEENKDNNEDKSEEQSPEKEQSVEPEDQLTSGQLTPATEEEIESNIQLDCEKVEDGVEEEEESTTFENKSEPIQLEKQSLELDLDVVETQEEKIKTPQATEENSPVVEKAPPTDRMTTSFIYDGESKNPFVESTSNIDQKEREVELDTLINESNDINIDKQVHKLDDVPVSVDPFEEEKREHDYDDEGIQLKGADPTDPDTWNLLALPKPVNPSDDPTVATNISSLVDDKKLTSASAKNGKIGMTSSPTTSSKAKSHINDGTSSSKLNTSTQKSSSSTNAAHKASNFKPVYVDVTHIPAHGNPHYVDSEFFKRVRARYYVLSALEPNQHVLNALLEGKSTWEDKNLQVSLITTYETDTLRHWYLLNEEQLAKNRIDLLPSAILSTLRIDNASNLDCSCQVFKLEF